MVLWAKLLIQQFHGFDRWGLFFESAFGSLFETYNKVPYDGLLKLFSQTNLTKFALGTTKVIWEKTQLGLPMFLWNRKNLRPHEQLHAEGETYVVLFI